MQDPSFNHTWPRLACFFGTFKPSCLQIRSTRLWFTLHPSALSIPVIMGAAGGLEFIATVLALAQSIAPPTANFTMPGDGCDLDYIPNQAREMRIDAALTSSFAFGGLNAVLLLRKV